VCRPVFVEFRGKLRPLAPSEYASDLSVTRVVYFYFSKVFKITNPTLS